MASELFPNAGEVKMFDFSGDGIRWPLFVSERDTVRDIQFFTRSNESSDRVLVVRDYKPNTDGRNQQLLGEREATIDEMVEFAVAARERFTLNDSITRELNDFVRDKLVKAVERIGISAVVGAQAEG